jgi:hypothetical protein
VTRFILLIVLFLLIARTFWRFIEAVVRAASGPQPPFGSAQGRPGGARAGGQSAVKMSQCPVCGTYVVPGKAISLASGGAAVYFDSEKCRAEYQSR